MKMNRAGIFFPNLVAVILFVVWEKVNKIGAYSRKLGENSEKSRGNGTSFLHYGNSRATLPYRKEICGEGCWL